MQNVSFLAPLDHAFVRTKQTLFSPFDIGKWFALGFSAWLAMLGEQGGSFNFTSSLDQKEVGRIFPGIGEVFRTYAPLIITVCSIGAVVAIALVLVFAWLNARGKFMFLDNVATGRSLVSQPWHQFGPQGDSLFGWMVVYGLCVLLAAALLIGAGIAAAWASITARVFDARAFGTVTTVSILFLALAIVMAYIQTFLVDFVVPIMWKRRIRAAEGWRIFGRLFHEQRGTFYLYGLMRLLVGAGAGAAVMLAGLLTCCCGFVLLMVPYINAVVLLPVTVFTRAYSLEFLRQFGAEYDVFAVAPAEPPPLAGAVPVSPRP